MYDLTPSLDLGSAVPQYEQLYRFISREVLQGRLKAGERLPPRRALSRHLGISEQTVQTAYELLKAEGFVRAEERRGLFVENIQPLSALPEQLPRTAEEIRESPLYDFSPQSTDIALFPHAAWAKAVREVLLDKPELMRRGDPRGETGLRQALSRFLYQFRGVHCPEGRLVIASGVDQLLGTLGALFDSPQRIAVEDPGYPEAARVLRRAGHRVLPLPLDEQGLDINALEKSKADLVYLTPAHQFPTGVSMPAGRRAELLHWANQKPGRYLIEDDYDSEFRYASRPLPALQSLDGQGKVVYLSTFSRSLAPGLRIAYMALPEELSDRFDLVRLRCGETVSRFEQAAMASFLAEGKYSRHLRKANAVYQKRCARLCGLLSEIPGAFLQGQEAGLHFLFGIRGRSEADLVGSAMKAGIRLSGLSRYALKSKAEPAVVIGFGGLGDARLEAAVETLKNAFKD